LLVGGREEMLRITVEDGEKNQTIKLEGKIAGPWIEEFERTCQSVLPSLGAKELHLDLRGVGYVDANGRALLREIYRKTNARFLADSPLTRSFVEDAVRDFRKSGQKGV
jgi:ABC-type transporter Mla MlaB component